MAIQTSYKQSELEKRVKILRQQTYGKRHIRYTKETNMQRPDQSITIHSENLYLRQDLLKISLLTALAFGIQITLFYLVQNNVLKIYLF